MNPIGPKNEASAQPNTCNGRFIPFRKKAIVRMLRKDGALTKKQGKEFKELARIVEAYYHFQFHHKLETLKDAYFPFNPDLDTQSTLNFGPEEKDKYSRCLTETLLEVLNDANYEPLSQADILKAFEEESLFSIKLSLDLDDFEECFVYARGNVVKEAEIKKFVFFKEQIKVPTHERVVLFMRFKDAGHFEDKLKERKKLQFEPGSTIIKIFKDMPHADLETLFPNTQLRMRNFDKVLLGVPAIGGVIPILLTKVLPHLPVILSILFAYLAGEGIKEGKWVQAAIQVSAAIFALSAYIWRQWEKFKTRQLRYLKTLSENLYFKNLDNNAGVFFRLIDSAEEEEFKEAVLAYYFLLTRGPQDSKSLDRNIENWFKDNHQVILNFEVDGALNKLIRLGIASETDKQYQVLPLEDAMRRIDQIWDGFFDYPEGPDPCGLDESEISDGVSSQARDDSARSSALGL
jgi:hypothetical protein